MDKKDKVSIQRFHNLIGTEPHPIDKVFLKQLMRCNIHEVINYRGKDITVTFRIKALAKILIDIIDKEGNV